MVGRLATLDRTPQRLAQLNLTPELLATCERLAVPPFLTRMTNEAGLYLTTENGTILSWE